MIVIAGFCYALYFTILGYAVRASYNLINKTHLFIEKKTDFIAHAFFLGIFVHVVIFNIFQIMKLSNDSVLVICGVILVSSLSLITWHTLKLGVQTNKIRPTKQNIWFICLTILGSSAIYWNSGNLPNIAWDSWMVWVGKADQWISHGLSVHIKQFDAWSHDSESIYNAAAHYPDGLSLIYFLPKLISVNNNGTASIIYLFAFVMISLLLVSRLDQKGTPIYLQLLFIVALYTTPLINNHLMIQGYADIWMAMYIVLIMLTFMDYHEQRDLGVGITLMAYLLMLPMLKTEGWVWLLLFICAHTIVAIVNHKHKFKLLASVLLLIGLIVILGGVHLQLPFGNLVIDANKIEFFNLINTQIKYTDINDYLLTGFFWQMNWSFLWLGLPFLLISFVSNQHNKASQISHVFFILALTCFMFLFYFTEASQWAEDLTALNRIVLQLTLCYLFLLFRTLTTLRGVRRTE
ncbi:hypothetical protein [Marinicella litoralis]|uniref:Dolichyl-phosphate-mannose-protein mannosyltransferase n=1 Tax=Marinicella litoralis TaxID=644220 RepID=A0A4R6XWN8_9GAMM|nr:hypothetical protein [Marinicella litoralis]TDR22664.1 hypothetical protein C8D91_1156 [Marinicella litoralis]